MENKWIKTMGVFAGEFNDLGIEQSIEESLAPFRFRLDQIVAYNESTTEGFATIWLMGTSITIATSVEDLDGLLIKG